jgi:hypothetical protein
MRQLALVMALLWGCGSVIAQPHYTGAYGNSPHCQSCHNQNNPPLNQYIAWSASPHASAYDQLPSAAKSNPVCLTCHTTGWDLSLANGGFDDYFYSGDSLGMAQMSNVQCESCHGPTSQIPHPATTVVDLHAEVCGDCHTGMGKPTYDHWLSSAHGQTTPGVAQNLACAKCHEATSAAAYLGTGVTPITLPPNPVWQVTCAACHATHSRDVYGEQLYQPADSTCRLCHTMEDAEVGQVPHSPQAEMILGPGFGGYEYPGYTYNNSCHQTYVPEACVLCHMWGPDEGNPDTTATGHLLSPDIDMCVVCHNGQIPPDSSFDINGAQTMIGNLLDSLGAMLAQADTTTIEYQRAKFNYDFVNNDKSRGVHNFMYAEDLLMSSMENLPMPGMVEIMLMPMMMMVHVPASGGTFEYDATLENMGTGASNFDAWIKVKMPNGVWTNPVVGPINLTLPGGATLTRARTQYVPGSAPNGTYTYRGYVGDYPAVLWDSSGFNFTKGMCMDGQNGGGSEEWLNFGEPFPGEQSQTALIPSDLSLAVSPNPFNATAAISYHLSTDSQISLQMYDLSGRLVATLATGWQEAGSHQAVFDGSRLASGIYLVKLTAGSATFTQKVVLLK